MKITLETTILLFFTCFLLLPRHILSAKAGYKKPSDDIVKIVDASNPPHFSVSNDNSCALLVESTTQLSLEDLAEPIAKVAGLRILKRYNILHRTYYVTTMKMIGFENFSVKDIDLPEGAKFGHPTWAPDGKHFCAAKYSVEGSELWVFNADTLEGKPVTPARLNSVLLSPYYWSRDSKSIYVGLWPEKRGEEPKEPLLPFSPRQEESSGRISQVRTFQDLISNDYDEELFEYYATSEIHKIDIATGKKTKLGKPGVYSHISLSPDQKYILVLELLKPYSRNVPYYYFPQRAQLWNTKGKLVKIITELPSGEEVPIEGVREGIRNLFWAPQHPASICWFEALDGGNPNNEAEYRDVLKLQKSPFNSTPLEIIKLPHRYYGLDFFDKKNLALITDYNRDTRWLTSRLIDLGKTNIASKTEILFSRNRADQYSDPGNFVYKTNKNGESLAILEEGAWSYMEGSGATPEGYRPFLHKFNIKTKEKQVLMCSDKESFSNFVEFANPDNSSFVISKESPTSPKNYFVKRINTDELQQITHYQSPTPELDNLKKELVSYTRDDGLPLSGTLYYPLGYEPGKKYPTIIWAYPREYTDASSAGQVRAATNRYARISGTSILYFALRGYAILNNAEIPIVGDPKTANDTFVEQLSAAAKAAVDKLVEIGIADRNKIGVAGHSYGAFMVANLLAHTDYFAAGVANSGAYNRTLTPFGFQGERRTFWEAKDIYMNMSPFTHADKIDKPILLIHGEYDPNPGTFPLQTERLFAAIKGHGGTAKMLILPYEGHGYEARESILHVLVETFDWFDKYLKNSK